MSTIEEEDRDIAVDWEPAAARRCTCAWFADFLRALAPPAAGDPAREHFDRAAERVRAWVAAGEGARQVQRRVRGWRDGLSDAEREDTLERAANHPFVRGTLALVVPLLARLELAVADEGDGEERLLRMNDLEWDGEKYVTTSRGAQFCTVAEFCAVNDMEGDAEMRERVRCLRVGEKIREGGGAQPAVDVERIS